MGNDNIIQYDEFSEQLAIYALDALADDGERIAVENALAQYPHWEQDFKDLQMAVAAIPYSAPLVPLAADLKDRLMARIESIPSISQLKAQADTVEWEPYAPCPGVLLGKFWVDTERREIQCFVRSHQGTRFPLHRHAVEEEIIVLDGDLSIDGQLYQKGDRIYSSSGSIHQPQTYNGCFIYIRTSLDDEMLASEPTATDRCQE